jgi:hypothetical protein
MTGLHGDLASGTVCLRCDLTLRPTHSGPGQRFLDEFHLRGSIRAHVALLSFVDAGKGLRGRVLLFRRPAGPSCASRERRAAPRPRPPARRRGPRQPCADDREAACAEPQHHARRSRRPRHPRARSAPPRRPGTRRAAGNPRRQGRFASISTLTSSGASARLIKPGHLSLESIFWIAVQVVHPAGEPAKKLGRGSRLRVPRPRGEPEV